MVNNELSVAPRCAAQMLARDKAVQDLGIKVTVTGAGEASAVLEIAERMQNGHGVCHGGLIFTLADTAFAFACNGYDRLTLAAGASIEFLRPARVGDVLTAVATEVHRGGKSGVYDVVVRDQSERNIARFRGRSHMTGQSILNQTDT